MSLMEKIEVPAPGPGETVKIGSEAHLRLMCRQLLDTHDPYVAALIRWPRLEEETRARIAALPIWNMAVRTEGRTGRLVKAFGETVRHPLLKATIDMDAFEQRRHGAMLAAMVEAYGITLPPEPAYRRPRDPEWAFVRAGYSKCIDGFFGFGLFRIAQSSGFAPPALTDRFEPVMREEGRHILFFVNWVAWWRRNMPLWRRPLFEMKRLAIWTQLVWERIDMTRGRSGRRRARDNNFTLVGSRGLGVEIAFPELAAICLREHERRLEPYDGRLLRPHFMPRATRLVARFMKKAGPAPA